MKKNLEEDLRETERRARLRKEQAKKVGQLYERLFAITQQEEERIRRFFDEEIANPPDIWERLDRFIFGEPGSPAYEMADTLLTLLTLGGHKRRMTE